MDGFSSISGGVCSVFRHLAVGEHSISDGKSGSDSGQTEDSVDDFLATTDSGITADSERISLNCNSGLVSVTFSVSFSSGWHGAAVTCSGDGSASVSDSRAATVSKSGLEGHLGSVAVSEDDFESWEASGVGMDSNPAEFSVQTGSSGRMDSTGVRMGCASGSVGLSSMTSSGEVICGWSGFS